MQASGRELSVAGIKAYQNTEQGVVQNSLNCIELWSSNLSGTLYSFGRSILGVLPTHRFQFKHASQLPHTSAISLDSTLSCGKALKCQWRRLKTEVIIDLLIYPI